jgi:cell division GTPase FtsZ
MGGRAFSIPGQLQTGRWQVNLLLLSTGGGGGNIVRSVKALFHRDLAVTRQVDATYAERVRAAVTTCCLDTNEFSLSDLPAEERLLIGTRTTGRIGARHNPDVARQALAESRSDVEALISRHSVIVVIGTGGKGTGAGTIFPLAQMARQQKKLVIPIFVRPSFERHEVDKRRYDHALTVSQQFDAAKIRLVEVLNDRGYADAAPQPQSIVWERMNLPIARGLRGLIYVLWDLSQVDPSDLSTLFAGHGRLRLGFGEIDPPDGQEPGDQQVDQAVRDCWENSYYTFGKPSGTSLICIQGEWSNVVDARIKGRLAALAMGGAAESPYNPLFARAGQSPRPWGVTALFAEHTGVHAPLEIDWPLERTVAPAEAPPLIDVAVVTEAVIADPPPPETFRPSNPTLEVPVVETIEPQAAHPAFSNLWEFAVAVNRSDPAAVALAGNGAKSGIPIEGTEVRKLVGTVWFRGVVPKLSQEWRTRLLDALVDTVEVPNHEVKVGRRTTHLKELSYGELQELARRAVPDLLRTDLDLLITIGRLWGGDALGRIRFTDDSNNHERSKFMSLLGFRG